VRSFGRRRGDDDVPALLHAKYYLHTNMVVLRRLSLSLLVSSDLTIWRFNWRNFGDRFERFIERFLFSNCHHTHL
jgi:hypothetical protein